METTIHLSLTRGVELSGNEDELVLKSPSSAIWPSLKLKKLTKTTRAVMLALAEGGITPSAIYAKVMEADGMGGLMQWRYFEARLSIVNLLSRSITVDGVRIATLEPISPAFSYREGAANDEESYVLSRFAFLRSFEDGFVLESSRGLAQLLVLSASVHQAVFHLRTPQTVASLAQMVPGLGADGARALLGFLVNMQAALTAAERAREDTSPELGPWAFHDLLFHARSRLGRAIERNSGLDPFEGKMTQPPIIKKNGASEVLPLFRPNMMKLKSVDVSFATVLESRGTIRTQGERPLTLEQLGEFLYRAARVRSVREDAGVSFRPYPGCGGIYALELYPLVNQCEGLAPGLYHYDPMAHALSLVKAPGADNDGLLALHRGTALLDASPQVVFIVTARFQRAQVKYSSVAYASILKDVGGLYQTMYLVAEAMGLAPVALGSGYTDAFGRAAELDYFVEGSVGEFILGSRPEPPPQPAAC